LERTVVAITAPNALLLADNPLSKIPTLILDDGTPLYDSLVICEYLDSLHKGRKLFPPPGEKARWTALRRHALGNGLLDLLILWRYERQREAPALSYADFRFPDLAWRARHEKLAEWHATFSQRESARLTVPMEG